MKKRLLSMILALAACLSMVPGAALAAETFEGEISIPVNVTADGTAAAEARSFDFTVTAPETDDEDWDAELKSLFEDGEVSVKTTPAQTNGAGTFSGTVSISMTENAYAMLSDCGIIIKQKIETADGWTYDDTEWQVRLGIQEDGTLAVESAFPLNKLIPTDEEQQISFTNTYTGWTITASAGEGGLIDPAGAVTAAAGTDKSFTITSRTGYKIEDVKVDGESVGSVSSYTFENVQKDHTIEATFAEVSTDNPTDPDETGVSDLLDTENHIAYLQGYPDGTFQPDGNMTRAEAAQMFFNLLKNQDVTITTSFSDVPEDAWYAKAVNTLASINILQGMEDGTFQPDRAITRAEFTTIAMRFAKLNAGGTNKFSDVHEGDWYYDAIVGSIQYGWIDGYEDGTFRPNNTIERAEVTAIMNRMLVRSADENYVDTNIGSMKTFPDVTTDHWAYYDIMEATNAHDYSKTNNAETWTGLR